MIKVNVIKTALTMGTLAPALAFAQLAEGTAGNFGEFIEGVLDLINGFLIPLLIALAVLFFIYGVFKYFIQGGADEDSRAQGRSLMLYAILGFVAIVALWAIVNFVANAFFSDPTQEIPEFPVGPDAGSTGGGGGVIGT